MDVNKVRAALSYTKEFRKIGYPYVNSAHPRESQETAMYMVCLQLAAALAQCLGRDVEDGE